MTITREQRARLAGSMFLAHVVPEGLGDSVTIIARGGESFGDTERFAAENDVLLNVGLAWIAIGEPAGCPIWQAGRHGW